MKSVSKVVLGKKLEIVKVDSTYLAWEDCNLNVYRWSDSKWVNLYRYNNYGFFCNGYPLEWNGRLHLLGGNGLINYHSDFLIFEEELGSWEFSNTKLQPLDYRSDFIGVGSTGIYALFGKKYNQRIGLDTDWEGGYFLDRSSLGWLGIEINWEKSEYANWQDELEELSIDLQDYLIMKLDDGWFILDKNTKALHFLKEDHLPISELSFLGVKENRLVWKNKGRPFQELEIKDELPNAFKVADLKLVPIQVEKQEFFNVYYFSIIFLFLGVVFIFLFLVFNRSKKKKSIERDLFKVTPDSEKSKNVDPWSKLLQVDGQTLNTSELDILFEIHNVNLENRKARRSKMIKTLNDRGVSEFGQKVIFRERDPMDKRFFRFRIEIKKP